MKCNEVEELMAVYVSGRGGTLWDRAIAAHLFTCASCRDWHAAVQETWHLWQDGAESATVDLATADLITSDLATPDLVTPVMQRLQRPRRAIPLPLPPLRQALVHYGIAASVAMVLFSSGLFDLYGEGVLNLNSSLIELIRTLTAFLGGEPGL